MNLRAAWRSLWDGKAAPRGGTIFAATGGPAWTPHRYDRLAEEGYRKNLIAYRAISEVARAVASAPWLLFRVDGASRREIEAHPLLDLLRRPNAFMSGGDFLEAVVAFYLIAGNSYVEAAGPDGRAPTELWPLRPDRVRIVGDGGGLPRAYVYELGAAKRSWPVDPATGTSAILHLKTFHPQNDWYGLAPLEAAAYAIDQHNTANAWNVALMQNSAAPSGALVFAPKDAPASLTDEQRAALKSELAEGWTGARRAGRPLVLEGGWDWKQIALSPKDLDWLAARHTTARDIAQAFGVPPMLLGIPGDATYANYREARLLFWEDTVVPLLRRLRDQLDRWLAPLFGDDLRLEVDLDDIPALTLRREAKFAMLDKANFLTVNEKRHAAGYGDVADGDRLPAQGERP